MSLEVNAIPHSGCHELVLTGSPLTEQDFIELHNIVNQYIEKESPNFIINLEGISLLNSLGLNALIKVLTKARNNAGDLCIVNISEKINQVLLLTKLNTVLNIASSLNEAVANFNKDQ